MYNGGVDLIVPCYAFKGTGNPGRQTLNGFQRMEDVFMLDELQERVTAIEEKLLQIRGYL